MRAIFSVVRTRYFPADRLLTIKIQIKGERERKKCEKNADAQWENLAVFCVCVSCAVYVSAQDILSRVRERKEKNVVCVTEGDSSRVLSSPLLFLSPQTIDIHSKLYFCKT